MLYRWSQLYLTYLDTVVGDVLMPHLTEPAPYMGQVLSPMGHILSVVGPFLVSPDVIQSGSGKQQKRFVLRRH